MNGWLLTGDLGKKDEDGFIYIVDRKKDLIISKGINIYPREIEEVIYKYEGVDAVAVIGLRDETKDEDVLAFIQPKEGVELQEMELRQYLKKHLANFKLPKHIYFVEELPKNATGKVLKRVLKEKVQAGGFLRKK
jgi:long-chain acyl-CoA synthetase